LLESLQNTIKNKFAHIGLEYDCDDWQNCETISVWMVLGLHDHLWLHFQQSQDILDTMINSYYMRAQVNEFRRQLKTAYFASLAQLANAELIQL